MPLTPAELTERLTPKHLAPIAADQAQADAERAMRPPSEVLEETDPRNAESYTFTVEHVDRRGKALRGEFTTKILTVGERQMVGVLRARFQGGQPVEQFDATTLDMNLVLAHCQYSLTQRPPWAKDLQALHDVKILWKIWAEVVGHENFFLGERPTPGEK